MIEILPPEQSLCDVLCCGIRLPYVDPRMPVQLAGRISNDEWQTIFKAITQPAKKILSDIPPVLCVFLGLYVPFVRQPVIQRCQKPGERMETAWKEVASHLNDQFWERGLCFRFCSTVTPMRRWFEVDVCDTTPPTTSEEDYNIVMVFIDE